MADGKVVIETDLDASGIKAGLSKLSGIAQSGIKGTLTAIASAGTALAGLGGAAFKVGMDFESAFAGVKKTVDATPEQLEQIRTSLLNLSKQIPLTATEIAGIAEAAGQLGIKTENIEKFTRVMADMGVATNLTSDEAATSLARLANIAGMSQDNFDRLGSVIVALGNNLATTESEIVEMGLRVAGAGKQIGLSESQIMSFAGALSSVGIEAEAGGSAFSTLMVNMQLACETGSDKLQDFASVAGMSADEFKESFEKDASEAILTFVQGLATCDEKGMSAVKVLDDMGIKEIRLRDALLRASGASDVFSESLRIGTDAWEENNALAKEAEQRYETTESKIILLKNSLSALGTELYDSVNTPIRTVIDSATSMVEQLTKAFKDGGLSGLVSELGTVFAEVATQAANSAPKMIDAATSMITSFLDGIGSNTNRIAEAAVKIGESLINGIAQIIPKVAEVGVEIIASLASNLLGSDVGKSVGELGKTIIDSFKTIASAVSGALNSLKPIFSTFISTVSKIAKTVIPPLTKVIEICISALKPMAPILLGVAGGFTALKVVKTVTGLIQKFTETEIVSNTITTIQNGLIWAKIAATEVLAKKITVAQAAQQLWNIAMGQNPIGAVVAAIGVFVGVLSGLAVALSGTNSEYQNAVSSLNKLKEAHEEVRAEQQKALEADFKEIDQINVLKTELDKLVDSNGKIKDGYLDRATAIAGELAEATGLEIEIIDGQIQKYGELGESIDAVITKKQMAALSNSLQEISDNAKSQLDEARAHLETVTKAHDEAQTAYDRAKEQAERTGDFSKLGSLERDLENKKAEMENQLAFIDSLREDMAMGTEAFAISASGDVKAMSDFMTRVSVKVDETGKAIIQSEASTYAERERLAKDYRDMAERTTDQYLKDLYIKQAEELERQNAQMDSSLGIQIALIDSKGEQFSLSYAALMDKAAEGVTNGGVGVDLAMQENMSAIITAITDSQLPVEEQTKLLADIQTQVFQNNAPSVGAAEQSTMQSVLDAISSTNPQMASAVQALVNAGILEMENGKIGFSDKARELGLNGNEALKEYIDDFNTTAKSIVEGAESGVTKYAYKFTSAIGQMASSAKEIFQWALKVNSPSKVFRDIAKSIPEGAALGVKGSAKIATDAISAMAKDMTSEYENSLDDFTTAGMQDAFDKLPEQEIKLVGLLERIKGLDATALMDQARAAVYSNQMAVAGAAARSTHTFTETRIVDMSSIPETESPKYVETTINIDGREFAKATTPYISKRLAWEG